MNSEMMELAKKAAHYQTHITRCKELIKEVQTTREPGWQEVIWENQSTIASYSCHRNKALNDLSQYGTTGQYHHFSG